MNIFNLPPESHADLAREAEAACKWEEAAQHWTNARTTSAGHKRRERYDEAAERCRNMAKAREAHSRGAA